MSTNSNVQNPAATLLAAVDAAMPLAGEMFADLARNTAGARGVTRASYGEGEQYAHRMLTATGASLGLEREVDAAGNLYLTLPGKDRAAPKWIVGSHMDSVPEGGNYDGAAGVLAGVVAVAGMKKAGYTPTRDVTVMAIRAEETGSWFSGLHGGHLGSRMALGALTGDEPDIARRVDTGRSLREHMRDCGFDAAAVLKGPPHLRAERIHGYLELHIEQGPLLEAKGLPVGVVNGIRGNSRLRDARCVGEYNHGGATPQEMRKDAVVATAELIGEIDRAWREGVAVGRDLVFTVGKLGTDPKMHSLSKVPGEVFFSLDLRSYQSATLAYMRDLVVAQAREIGNRREVRFELGGYSVTAPGVLDEKFRAALAHGCTELAIPFMEIASGGGHDAADFSAAGVPAAMIFVRNANGSHKAEEAMSLDDFAHGTRLLAWMLATH